METPPLKTRLLGAFRFALTATAAAVALLVFGSLVHQHYKHKHPPELAAASPEGNITAIAYEHVVPYRIERFEQALRGEKRPVLLFFYTSWCPYCQKDFPLVNQLTLDHGDQFATYVVSLDTDPGRLDQFIARQPRIGFTPYNIPTQEGQLAIADDLKRRGLTFDGGFPYFAVFIDGKAVGEVKGLLEKDTFDGMLSDVIRRQQALHPSSLGRGQQQTYLLGTN